MDKCFILKVDIPGTNAGAKVNYNEKTEVFEIETSTGYTCISTKAIEDAGYCLSDWFETESPEVFNQVHVLRFAEHLLALAKSKQEVKAIYEMKKFFNIK